MPKLTKLEVAQYWELVKWFVYSLAFGVALLGIQATWHLFPAVVEKVAEGFVVAGIIGIVVELSALNRLIEHVGTDVAKRISAQHLPEPVRRHIWGIVNSTLVRQGYEKSYRLTHLEEGRVQVQIVLRYFVKNYGPQPEEYAPELSEEKFYAPKFQYVSYSLTNGTHYSFNEKELNGFVRDVEGTGVKSVDRLPKLVIPPNAECEVTWRYVDEMSDDYSDITSFGGPTIDATLRVDQLPEDMIFVSDGQDLVRVGDTWKFQRSFVAGQHVRVWWSPKASGTPL